MLKTRVLVAVAMVLGICLAHPPQAVSLTFDFETVSLFASTPFAQTSTGVTATFSSPAGAAFSVQSAFTLPAYTLSQFSGHYLYPNDASGNALDIVFSRLLTGISMTFATVDNPDPVETPRFIELTAYVSSPSTLVGSATARGTYAADSFPMGTLAFTSATSFDQVRIVVPFQLYGQTGFFADNINVTLAEAPPNPAPVPEPGTMGLLVAGWLASTLVRRRTK